MRFCSMGRHTRFCGYHQPAHAAESRDLIRVSSGPINKPVTETQFKQNKFVGWAGVQFEIPPTGVGG
jgi:hypothetical protein